MPINVDIDREDKERAASFVGRIINGLLLAIVVVLITPGRIGAGIQALWNAYLMGLGVVAGGLDLAIQGILTWYHDRRRRIHFFGIYLPLASWVLGAWIGGNAGRVIVVLGSIGAVAITNLIPLILRLLARGGQLLVEMVQVPVGAGIKGIIGVLRSVSPESFEEKDGEIVFINTERLVAAVSETDIVPMTVAAVSFWLVLFPSFTTLFGCVLVLFGGLALIHMGGLWDFETKWGKRALFRLTKAALALAIAGLFYAAVFPKSAEWIWAGSGKVDAAMVECASDIGECATGPFLKRSASPIIAMQAPRALQSADSVCRYRMSQLQEEFDLGGHTVGGKTVGGMRFSEYRTRLEQITRSCEGDRRSVSATVKSDWSLADRAVAFLPFLGWLAFLGLAILFIKRAAKVRAARRQRQAAAGTAVSAVTAVTPSTAPPAEVRSKWQWVYDRALPVVVGLTLLGAFAYRVWWNPPPPPREERQETPVQNQSQPPAASPAPTSSPAPSYRGSGRTTESGGAHDSVGLRELDELDRRDRQRRERYTWLGEPGATQ